MSTSTSTRRGTHEHRKYADDRSAPSTPRYNNHPHNVTAWWYMRDERHARRKRGLAVTALELSAWLHETRGEWLRNKCLSPAVVYAIACDVAGPPTAPKP